jgi:hypothetical protein
MIDFSLSIHFLHLVWQANPGRRLINKNCFWIYSMDRGYKDVNQLLVHKINLRNHCHDGGVEIGSEIAIPP